jgi:hypothetical protein
VTDDGALGTASVSLRGRWSISTWERDARLERRGAARAPGAPEIIGCVIYSFTGDAQELIEKARAGILPIFKKQPGFLAYGVMTNDDQIVSMSAWNSESDARAADEAAKDWVSKNVDMTVVNNFMGDYDWLEFAER